MKKLISATILTFALALAATSDASAIVRCETLYGGGQACVETGGLQINKKIFNPKTNVWEDNIPLSAKVLFTPGSIVKFRLDVKNVTNETVTTVDVVDSLPGELEHVSGDTSFTISSLAAGETKSFFIDTKVKAADKLPEDLVRMCVANAAEVKQREQVNLDDRDVSSFCIDKRILGVQVLPVTGAEHMGLLLGSFITTLAAGTALIKKFS